MALTTYAADTAIIAALATEPNETDGLTEAQYKAKFDEAITAWKAWFNATHIPELDAAQLPYIYGSTDTIKTTMESLTAGVIPDDSVTTAKINSAAVTLEKLSADVAAKVNLSEKNLLNILQMKLQMALSSTNIDAWSDLLADTSLINTGASTNYVHNAGSHYLYCATGLGAACTTTGQGRAVGTPTCEKIGQTLLTTAEIYLAECHFRLNKTNSPTDGLLVKVYSSDKTTLLGTSATMAYSSLSTSIAEKTFTFATPIHLLTNTTYFLVLERTGTTDATNYYSADGLDVGGYSSGAGFYYASSTWTESGDYWCEIDGYVNATVIWNAVTAEEAFTRGAICIDSTMNNGNILVYMSDDGTNWTTLLPDTMSSVSFSNATVYIKATIVSDAQLNGIAYGGY